MQLKRQPLPSPRQESLSQWFEKPEFSTLLLVLENLSFAAQHEGSNLSMQAIDLPGKAESAKVSFEEAAQINRCIKLLEVVRKQAATKKLFDILTAEPTPTE